VLRRVAVWIVVVAFCGSACTIGSAESNYGNPPGKVLFVGNSFIYYNNSLHNHYKALVRSSGYEFDAPSVTRIMTISGGHLPEHRGGLASMLASEDWNTVIMQGHSLEPIREETAGQFRDAAHEYAALIRERGAVPMLFMTWAYTGRPDMTAALDTAYSSIGQELGVEVVPVGLAFATVTSERPDIELRIADARHPTLAGTYLAACTFYAALVHQSPVGLTYTAGLNAEDAAYLQGIAQKTVSEYRVREAR